MTSIQSFINSNTNNDIYCPFFVFNVEDMIEKHRKWCELLPKVVPYYAIKANPSPLMLEMAMGLGLKFDCTSKVFPVVTKFVAFISTFFV